MNITRSILLAKRYLLARFFKIEDIIDFIFWPLLDIIIWGGVGLALAKSGQPAQQVTVSIVSVVMLRVYLYSFFNNAANFLYEMMARNIINLFSTPLSFNEWLLSGILSGFATSLALVVFATGVSKLFFNIYLLSAGPGLAVFVLPLLISGWAMAHLTIVLLMLFGVHAQRLVFVMGWLLIPFSGVYYSLEIMPSWIQIVSRAVPMSYIFSALRIFILNDRFSWNDLAYGYGLALFYFIITTFACNRMFERSRQLGLASLERS
jgi:ABC-2 type transport system permease protein